MNRSGRIPIIAMVLCGLALIGTVVPAHAQGPVHVVQQGETLSSIAARYGTTVQAIAQANGLSNLNLVYVGQRLVIPTGGSSVIAPGGTYTVRAGDTLWSIAVRHGTTVPTLMQANGLTNASYLYVGQRLTIPGGNSGSSGTQGGGSIYVVRSGDTLASIASRHGVSVSAIVSANGLANPNYIYPGQRLHIPSSGQSVLPLPSGKDRRIVVDLSEQRMYVYQNGQLIWNWVVSTGRPGQETVVGHYQVLNKLPMAYAYTWSLKMPYWLGIYWAGRLQNGIHALPILPSGQRLWEGYLGQRVSYGCVILSTENAATLYNWASVGTPVDIVW
ncbi:MAG: LysM peptidoglycan-binding domain-containing protein [Anaerolineae bacterium]